MSTAKNELPTIPMPQRRGPARTDASGDQTMLTNFSRSATCSATLLRPQDDYAWEQLFARPGRGGVTVRGGGASYSDAALNDGGTVAVTTAQPRIVGWDQQRGLLDVDAGLTLGQALSFCVPLGWTLPVLPGTAQATMGGAFAADVHGKNHTRSGSFSSTVREIVLVTPGQGVLTVGPDTRPEIFWATVGGLGLTGAVQRLRLQLAPISSSWLATTDAQCADLDEVLAVMVDRGQRHEHVVAWVDGYAPVDALGRGVVSAADHVASSDLPERLRGRALRYDAHRVILGAPATLNLIRPGLIRVANAARFARAGARSRPRLSDFSHTFHPLDAIADWPVAYGKNGLIQYQFSVPLGQEQVLTRVLRFLPAAACPPTLVVLKRLGAGSPAALSFPSPGWTMALDLPAAAAALAAKTLDRLDDMVNTAGGRIYLVKDSRLQPHLVPAMYPRLSEWREVRDRVDPEAILTSALDRRLNLTGHHARDRSC